MEEKIKNYTSLQKKLHLPDTSKNKDHPSNTIYSYFNNNLRKCTPYKKILEKLSSIEDPLTSTVKCSINMKHDILLYTKIVQNLPTIILKTPTSDSKYIRYEGKWTHNIGSNIYIEGKWNHNDENIQYLDHIFNDQYHQVMITTEDKNKLHECIGNGQILQTWNVISPNYQTSFIIPWSYSIYGNFYPLFMCGELDIITHDIKIRREIKDLYQIRGVLKNNDYEYLNFDSEYIHSIGGLTSFEKNIPLTFPEIIGEYANISDSEKNMYKCSEDNMKNIIYVNNVIPLDSDNLKKCGETMEVKYEKDLPPIHTYMWVAQNQKSVKNKVYSNYSTFSEGFGYNPIEKTTISGLFENMSHIETSRDHVYKYFPSKPHENGYNYWTLGLKARDNYPIPTDKINNLKITVTLKDNNPYNQISKDHKYFQKSTESEFQLKVRLIYLRKITIECPKNNDNNYRNFKSKIIIEE